MDKKVLNFELSSQNIQIKSVLANDFIQIECWAISNVYPNRNNSHFTIQSINDALPTVYNKPALGAFVVSKNDFKAHESVLSYDRELENEYFDYTNGKCEIPLGVIRESDLVEVVEKDGLTWLHFTCALWARYGYRQIKRLLKDKDKKISVEVEVLEEHEDEEGIEVIDKFVFDGFTILGSDVKEAIPGAHLTIIDKTMQAIYQKQEKTLTFAYQGLDEKMNASAKIENKNISSEIDPISGGEVVPIPAEVKNEDTEEIEMEKFDEERGVNEKVELTYQQKREILDIALHKYVEGLEEDTWGYIEDLDDENVYYEIGREDFKAPYEITGEEELFATIHFESAVRVVRSWQEYTEEKPEENPAEGKETNAAEGEGKETCAEGAEGKETCADDHDDDDHDDDGGHKECASGCEGDDGKEEFTKVDGVETPVIKANGEKIDTADVNENSHIPSKGARQQARADDGKSQGEMPAPEDIGSTLESNGIRFSVKDEKGEDKELTFATTDELIADYQEKLTKLYSAEAELNTKVRQELFAFGESYVDGETDLTAENAQSIKATFKADLEAGKYSCKEDFAVALDRSIADALYAQKKANRTEGKHDFSTPVVKTDVTVGNHADDDVSALKSAANKLRNI